MQAPDHALSTGRMNAYLTLKQADMLSFIVCFFDGVAEDGDGKTPQMVAPKTSDIADIARDFMHYDLAEGVRPNYFGVNVGSIRSCLNGLAARNLIYMRDNGTWWLTRKGYQACRMCGFIGTPEQGYTLDIYGL